MVLNGQINTQIVAACRQLDLPAIGLSGVDAGLVRARRRAPVRVAGLAAPVDYGYVGDIESVDTTVLQTQLENGLLPVVSPLSADAGGTLLNINADTIAAALAAALGAAKLILATAAPGILEDRADPASLVSYVDLAGLARLEAAGALADGMLPKAKAIEGAIRGGVSRVHVISYKVPDSLLLEVFTNEGTGTLVVESIDTLSKEEQAGA
jgi:acetylglutamate kinase